MKPWKSYQEQLEILKERGMIIDDEAAAAQYLDRVGYYRLSGYWYSFRELEYIETGDGAAKPKRKNRFIDGAHFEHAVKLYVFDKKLRLLALDALERIELAIRVDIAHLLGEKDIHAYENPNLFHGHFSKKKNKRSGKTDLEYWQEKHNGLLHRARREPFVQHYQQKYGKLPIWVAIEVWDFGMLSKMYSGMKLIDKASIAAKYQIADPELFQSWLRSLNFIRNVSAHHSRLWNINVLERSPVWEENEYWGALNNSRPFYYFCVLQKLMRDICPNSHWHQRLASLLEEFPDLGYCNVSLKQFGLIDGWDKWDIWL